MKALVIFLSVMPLLAVDGTVINRTTGKPQGGATVTLYKLGQAGMESMESVKSGADGKFLINQPVQGPHLIQTAYDGVTYNHMLPPGSATANITLDVYNSSKKPGGAKLTRHFLIFQPSGSQLSINEGFIFQNDGLTTYSDPDGGTLKFYLPPGADGKVQVKAKAPQGMPIDQAADKTSEKGIYKVAFPIKPGETNFTVMYAVPYTSPAIYEGKLLYKTPEPTLVGAPPGITLKGEGLEIRGTEPNSQTTIYSVKSADFKVEIAGTLAAAAGTDTDSGPALEEVMPKIWTNMKWLLALALAILALGFIVLYRAQPAPAATHPPKGKNARGRR